MKSKQQTSATLLALGMIMLLVTASLPLIGINTSWLKYIYATGAVFTLVARLLDRYNGKNITLKRLYRILIVSSICYCVSATVLFSRIANFALSNYVQEKDWLAFLTAGVVLQLYATFRIESVEKKESKKN